MDRSGKRLWARTGLPFESQHGVASSPVLAGDRLVVLSESAAGAYLAALDARTGRLLWRTKRDKPIHAFSGTCRTPSVREIAGRPTILVWGSEDLSGYDPVDGRELWSRRVDPLGMAHNPVANAASDAQFLYLAGPEKTLALRVADLANPGVRPDWEAEVFDGVQCSSPLVTGGLLFAVSDNGAAYCQDARAGKELWRRELGGLHYASPVSAGGYVYFCGLDGTTTVITADRAGRIVSENDLGEPIYASPALVDGALFIRTKRHLYCLREG